MKSHHVPFLDGHLPVCADLNGKHANSHLYLKRTHSRTLEISGRQRSRTEYGWAHKVLNFKDLLPVIRFFSFRFLPCVRWG